MSYQSHTELPRNHRWAGWSAVGTALLFASANSFWGFQQPGAGASGARLLDFYGDLSGRIVAGALLSLISIAMFVVFASAFRSVLTELEGDELLANVAFAGALVGLATGLAAETINMAAALRAGDGELTQSLAQALFDTSYVLGYNAAGIGIGLLALATGSVALRARAMLPRWLAVVSVVLGVALLTPLSRYVLGASFLLLLVLGVLLLRGSAVGARELGKSLDEPRFESRPASSIAQEKRGDVRTPGERAPRVELRSSDRGVGLLGLVRSRRPAGKEVARLRAPSPRSSARGRRRPGDAGA